MTQSDKWADVPQRLLTAIIGLPIVLAGLFIGSPISTIGIILIALIAMFELYHISHINKQWQGLFLMGMVIYIGIPMGLLVVIRDGENGLSYTLLLLITNWTTDSMALIGGRLFGKHKVAPHISSGKTWEGVIIGFISACIAGWLVGILARLSPTIIIIAPPMVACMTILGDLLESRIKRLFHVKDASQLLPGHGGFLDRIDGLLLAIPIFYLIIN
ncbi:MAG: phosphatidate cytidylyltransferase [Phototrophicales bacterium]|jgi:phosphatidate cytidylyltransferase|nr:MAG: phosphatidate cytidylyltransferase [Phototrophicales bacterium]